MSYYWFVNNLYENKIYCQFAVSISNIDHGGRHGKIAALAMGRQCIDVGNVATGFNPSYSGHKSINEKEKSG
jgi:hypothetical protein